MKTAELNASRDVSSCYNGFLTKEVCGRSGLVMKKITVATPENSQND